MGAERDEGTGRQAGVANGASVTNGYNFDCLIGTR